MHEEAKAAHAAEVARLQQQLADARGNSNAAAVEMYRTQLLLAAEVSIS